jgi:cystathionine gamma-synthase
MERPEAVDVAGLEQRADRQARHAVHRLAALLDTRRRRPDRIADREAVQVADQQLRRVSSRTHRREHGRHLLARRPRVVPRREVRREQAKRTAGRLDLELEQRLGQQSGAVVLRPPDRQPREPREVDAKVRLAEGELHPERARQRLRVLRLRRLDQRDHVGVDPAQDLRDLLEPVLASAPDVVRRDPHSAHDATATALEPGPGGLSPETRRGATPRAPAAYTRRVPPVPLDRSTIWAYRDGQPGDFYYSRYADPTTAAAEQALGELDGGEALLFPSGSAAITALTLGLLEPGKTIALANDAYYGTGVLLRELGRWGVRVVEFDQTGPPPEGVDLVWVEAPSNPFLTMPDLEAAARHPASVVVDATASTPVYLRPLEHDADFVLHSATKYLGGHHDVLLGAVVCREPETAARLRDFRGRSGIVPAPDPAWLLLRSLKTLHIRMERHTATASTLASRLEEHPAVERVRYPGFGGMLSFDVAGGGEAARTVETATRRIANATSLGGADSTLETRARWEPERVPPGLVRLSVGLEDADDLWSDLESALNAARRPAAQRT